MNIIELIKSTKIKNLNFIVDQIKELDTEISDMFSEAVDQKEKSIYKLELLSKKLQLLDLKKQGLEIDFKEYGANAHKLRRIRMNFCLIAFLIAGISLIAFNLYFIYSIVYGLFLFSLFYTNHLVESYENEVDGVEEIFRIRGNTLFSCKNILNKKINKKRSEVQEIDLEKTDDFDIAILANKMICEYLENNKLVYISDKVSEHAIKMLQYELDSDSEEVLILLDQAKKHVNSESNHIALARTRGKNEENNKTA